MLEIKDLSVKMNEKTILHNISFSVPTGQTHALMGPNGSGKSTLAYVIAGKPEYEIISGKVLLNGVNLLELTPEERSLAGLFLALQYPTEIPGINNSYFIKTALNAHLKHQGKPEIDPFVFIAKMKAKMKELNIPEKLMGRSLNEGFSGGEKKCNEILQMLILEPKFSILDETDSGLDIDTIKTVAQAVNNLKSPERGALIITHYQRLLNYIEPDIVHIMIDGRIIKTGDKSLVEQLEHEGYTSFAK